MKTTLLSTITSKPSKRRGVVHAGRTEAGAQAEIVEGASIRLFGTRYPGTPLAKAYDRAFKVGDVATYDSYNLVYLGKITSITPKTVTVTENDGRVHRLDIYEFDFRNWALDLAETHRRNMNTMEAI